MSEVPDHSSEQKITPTVFNGVMRELVRLASSGEKLTQADNQGFYDYEEFTELDTDTVVGKQSSRKVDYEGMILDIDVIMYGEATSSLKGKHSISYLFLTPINEEYEFPISVKYRFHNDSTVVKEFTSGVQKYLSQDDIETGRKMLKEIGIDPDLIYDEHKGNPELLVAEDELKKLTEFLGKVS